MLVNEIIIAKIQNLLDFAIKTNSKTKYLYKKIYEEIKNKQIPIFSKTQIKNINNVGPKISKILISHVESVLNEKIADLDTLEKYSLLLDENTYNNIKNRITLNRLSISNIMEENDSDISLVTVKNVNNNSLNVPLINNNTPTKKKSKKNSTYVPVYKSAAYGLLKALWIEDGISKHRIIYLAKNYSSNDFDLTTKFSGWNSMKTLVKKNFVYKEMDTKKYFLTLEGQNLSNKIFKNTSIIKVEDNEIILLIDSREIKNRSYRSFFQNFFESKSVKYETRVLEVGDFTWIKNDEICDYIVERKCGSDFVSSIVDGRLKEQKSRLIKTGILNIFYIIENLKQKDFKNISLDYGSFCLTSLKMNGFIVIETENINETGDILLKINSSIQNQKECATKMTYGSFIEKSNKNNSLNVKIFLYYAFLSIRGINYEKAKKLTDYFMTYKNFTNFVKDGTIKTHLKNKIFELSSKNIEKILKMMCN